MVNGPIKTIKIRGCLSQGLFIKMKDLPLDCKNAEDEAYWLKNNNVTNLLKVTKRQDTNDESQAGGLSFENAFPLGPPKTDEPRIQGSKKLLSVMKGKSYYMALKYDGCSMTVTYDTDKDRLVVCSRNLVIQQPDKLDGDLSSNHYWDVCVKYDLESKLRKHPNYVIQGEVYGPKIQQNHLGVKENKFAVFSIWDKEKKKYVDFNDFIKICDSLRIPHVDIIETGDSFNYSVEDLLEKTKGKYPGTKNHREGIVIRPQIEELTVQGYRLSFKCINNKFLLKNGQ